MIQRIILTGLILSTSVIAGQPQSVKATQKWVKKNGHTIIKDFAHLLSMPNVASDKLNLRRNAKYISNLFKKRGFDMQLLETEDANPIIYGEYKTPGAKRTLCFYVHYDGQPVDLIQWTHGPFDPILYDASMDAGGKPIPLPMKQTKIDLERA